jgi:hypothetical protein
MTRARLAVVVLPGCNVRGDSATASIESVMAEVDAGTPIVALADRGPELDDRDVDEMNSLVSVGLSVFEPGEALQLADVLAFVRPGDRWCPGTLEIRRRQLDGHPRAAFSVAAHELVDAEGSTVLIVRAPSPPIDPIELLMRPSIEPATVLVRVPSMDGIALSLLTRTHGDAVLWSRLARADGFVSSGEIAAKVPIDPERHGFAPRVRTAQLIAAASCLAPLDGLGAANVRQELLRRLYLEPEPGIESVDLTALLGGFRQESPGTAAVISDLQWALERQSDALRVERIRWPEDLAEEDKDVVRITDADLLDQQAAAFILGSEVVLRDSKIRRLEAEVYRRDAIIAELTDRLTAADGAES